jgi:hypothetical protein
MGRTAKAIIGIGLIATGLGAFGAMAGLGAYVGVGALTYGGLMTLVGASLLGSALAPDVGDIGGVDSYSGIKLQTQKSNTNPVPIIYGQNKIAGNIIYQTTNSAINNDDAANGYNRDYWAVMVFAGHNIDSMVDMWSSDNNSLSVSGTKQTEEYVHIDWGYTSTATNIQGLNWVTDSAFSTSTGTALGLDSVVIPADCSYLLVHQVFDAQQSKNIQLDNIIVEIKGKKIRTMTDANTISTALTYSNNPVNVVLDLLTNALSVDDSSIDTASFYQSQQDCINNGWECNVALIQQANIQSIIQDVLATCRGQIVHSNGSWKLKIDTKSQTSVATLTDDDFINNSLSISMKGNRDISNKIIVKYVNPSDEWLSAQVVKEDTTLQSWDGQTLEKTLDIKGITNQTQAEELAEITLNTMRYTEDDIGTRVKQTPLALSFSTTVKNAHLEVGDVITIDSDLLDRDRKFMILSVETDQSGLIQISTREYCETHYKDSSGTYLI